MKKDTFIDIVVFVFLIFITVPLPFFIESTWFNNPVVWSFIVAGPVSIYFGLRRKKNWKKIIVGSLVFGSLFGVILEYFAHISLAWQVPTTIFPFRILGANTIDAVIGYIPMTIFVLVFYEHFFDNDAHHKISPHIWRAIIPAIVVVIMVIIFHFIDLPLSGWLGLKYGNAYIKMGILAITPMIVQLIRFPKLFSKYAMLSVSLFWVFLLLEIVGVSLNYWIFPGKDYIGTVTAFGKTFPLEEIIFWMFLYPPTIAAYYEKCIDDEK